jgi:chromosome segregation ATPase
MEAAMTIDREWDQLTSQEERIEERIKALRKDVMRLLEDKALRFKAIETASAQIDELKRDIKVLKAKVQKLEKTRKRKASPKRGS